MAKKESKFRHEKQKGERYATSIGPRQQVLCNRKIVCFQDDAQAVGGMAYHMNGSEPRWIWEEDGAVYYSMNNTTIRRLFFAKRVARIW